MKAQDRPTVGTRGLVTLAYLKARLDSGEDHLGIFMPLVLDVLPRVSNRHFTSVDVQEAIETTHAVKMPETTVATLLRRARRSGLLEREHGRFRIGDRSLPRPNIAGQKAQLGQSQERFAIALMNHANVRGIPIESVDSALQITLRFIGEQQISLLLENSAHFFQSSSWICVDGRVHTRCRAQRSSIKRCTSNYYARSRSLSCSVSSRSRIDRAEICES